MLQSFQPMPPSKDSGFPSSRVSTRLEVASGEALSVLSGLACFLSFLGRRGYRRLDGLLKLLWSNGSQRSPTHPALQPPVRSSTHC